MERERIHLQLNADAGKGLADVAVGMVNDANGTLVAIKRRRAVKDARRLSNLHWGSQACCEDYRQLWRNLECQSQVITPGEKFVGREAKRITPFVAQGPAVVDRPVE